ncbi:MAG: hypothetical protein ACOXZ5_10005 [Syntrophomonadaceae bacterium]|jgi:hypothetical protein
MSLTRKTALAVVMALICLTIPGDKAEAGALKPNGNLYLLVIDKLFINDIHPDTTNNLAAIVDEGALGLASSRTLRGKNALDNSLTMGAGNLARAFGTGLKGFNRDELPPNKQQDAKSIYKSLTGIEPGESQCLLINLPEILAGMEGQNVTTKIGTLGDQLGENNIKICILGNGDTMNEKSRNAIALAIDSKGQVPLGDIGPNTYCKTENGYLEIETNYDYLKQKVEFYSDQAGLIIIELSDLARLEKADIAFPEIFEAKRAEILNNIDDFAGFIRSKMDPEKDLLMVISPSASKEEAARNNYFTPVIVYGKDYQQGGLTSPTTRREWIVANTDIAPTILDFFGLTDREGTMIGRKVISQPFSTGDELHAANKLVDSTSMINRLRPMVIKYFVTIEIIAIVLAILVLFFLLDVARIVEYVFVVLSAVPLVFLLLGNLSFASDWLYIFMICLTPVIIASLFWFLFQGQSLKAFFAIALLTALALDLDLLSQARMIKNSILGYDPVAGARYYGIGNEYLGILMGSSIICAAAIFEKWPTRAVFWGIAAFFILQTLLIGSPGLGANTGGLITSPIAYLATILLLANIPLSPRLIISILTGVILILLGVFIYDMGKPMEMQSHIGRASVRVMDGGWGELLVIMNRKIAMNLKLIKSTIWSRVFMVILAAISLFFYRPAGAINRLLWEHPCWIKGLAGIIIAALVLLAVNDSGIVAASTASIYLVVPMLLMMLNDQKMKNDSR